MSELSGWWEWFVAITSRSGRLKNALRELYAQAPPREIADAELTRWYSRVRRCRVERLALTRQITKGPTKG
ncbi:hypothetical protein [uncultured Marinobacter sp.]|uniref:hypothetical protein n=1 Tax=uncultured Marinobacter sp. TaxID=187379 RepID=UPI0030DB62EE